MFYSITEKTHSGKRMSKKEEKRDNRILEKLSRKFKKPKDEPPTPQPEEKE